MARVYPRCYQKRSTEHPMHVIDIGGDKHWTDHQLNIMNLIRRGHIYYQGLAEPIKTNDVVQKYYWTMAVFSSPIVRQIEQANKDGAMVTMDDEWRPIDLTRRAIQFTIGMKRYVMVDRRISIEGSSYTARGIQQLDQ
jgi:hypothetical protein